MKPRSLFSLCVSLTLVGCGLGCSGSVDTPSDGFNPASGDGGGDDTGTTPTDTCTAALTLAASTVVEMRASGAKLSIDASDPGGAAGDHALKVTLEQDGKPVKTLWDKPASGKVDVELPSDPLAPGAYDVSATLGCPSTATNKTPASAKGKLYVVRLGATSVHVGGDARLPLMYHAVGGTSGNYYPLDAKNAASSFAIGDGEADLDDKDGKPRAFPTQWDKLDTPATDAMGAVLEDGQTYPIALKTGGKPSVTLTVGKTAWLGGKAIATGLATTGLPDIRIVLDGAPKADTKITEGGDVTFTVDAAPIDKVGQTDWNLTWHFEAKNGSDWQTIDGSTQSVKLKVYGILGNEIGTTAPNLPWVAVVDAATKEIAGKTNDPAEVRKMLVRLVYEDFGLGYDRKSGASAYTSYVGGGGGWSAARFDLTSFLKRSRGNTVNCTDCASILSTYANMVGAKLHYAIIGWNFSLNPIQGIGATTAGSPFDSGRMAFSYHAVTTPDSTATIDDATLALDGDTDPTTAPFSKLLVQNVSGPDYLKRLSPGAPEYKYADQVTTVR